MFIFIKEVFILIHTSSVLETSPSFGLTINVWSLFDLGCCVKFRVGEQTPFAVQKQRKESFQNITVVTLQYLFLKKQRSLAPALL